MCVEIWRPFLPACQKNAQVKAVREWGPSRPTPNRPRGMAIIDFCSVSPRFPGGLAPSRGRFIV